MSKEESTTTDGKIKHIAIGVGVTVATFSLLGSGGLIGWKINDAVKDSKTQSPLTLNASSTSPTTVADMAAAGKG